MASSKGLVLSFIHASYLQFGIGLLGIEFDLDWEEVVGVPSAAELHGATLIRGVYHRELPEESTALFVSVVPVALSHHRCVHAVSRK